MKKSKLVKVGNTGLELPRQIVPDLKESPSLSDTDQEDRYIPYYCFNMRLKDSEGNWIPSDVFFHTLREDTKPELHTVLLFLHKTNRYRIFDEQEGSKTLCQSLDRITGTWQQTGEAKKCAECEYAPLPNGAWKEGKPPPCKLCYNFVGLDLEDKEPFVITAKSTSATPAKKFLNRYFLGKLGGKNLPLFVYKTKLSLVMRGTYSVLQFEITDTNSPSEIKSYAAMCKELSSNRRVDFTQEQPEEVEPEDEDVPF